MSTPTSDRPKERSVPKPVFTDAEAGAKEFPSSTSRQYNYFTPAKRRATVYEDVTIDVQPDPERHLSQGWLYGFADGPGGYPKEWTALKATNWHAFLDPNEEWEQTIYRNNSSVVRHLQQNLANAKASGSFAAWNRSWAKIVERHVGAWAHVEHGIGMHVHLPANRDAPTNMINNALAVAATHKLRFAQDMILYNMELADIIEGFDGSAHKQAWQNDAEWQGVRKAVEGLTGIRDWAEAEFATSLVFEPLVGELFRSQFVMLSAAHQGDFVTPVLMGAGEADNARDQRGTRHLFRLLADDAEHGEANKAVMQGWLDTHSPAAVEAARQLQPIWSQVAEKVVKFEDSYQYAAARLKDLMDPLGLNVPQGV